MKYEKSSHASWAGGGWTHRKLQLGRYEIDLRTGKSDLWGRFGGGWNLSLGIQMGSGTVLMNLLVCSITLHRRKGCT